MTAQPYWIERLRAAAGGWPVLAGGPLTGLLLALAAYVFLAPNIDFAPNLQWHDGQRLAQLAVLGVMALLLWGTDAGGAVAEFWNMLPRRARLALSAAFGLGLCSVALAPLPRWALLEWALLLLLIVLMLAVAAARRRAGDMLDRVLVMLFLATATAYAAKTVTVYLTMLLLGPDYGLGFNVRELYTGFSNIRFFGHVQTMLLPFLLLPALWWGRTAAQRFLFGIVPALWWTLAVGSGTRGTWAALLAGAAAVVLFGGTAGRRWLRWQTAGLAAGLLVYGVFILLIPWLLNLPSVFLHRAQDLLSLSLREVIWRQSVDYIAQHPLLGIGPMHFAYAANPVAAHPHNAVLQLMAEWGVPAAVLLVLVCAAGGLAYARRVRRLAQSAPSSPSSQALTAVALLAALTGAAAQALVDGVIVMPVSQMLLALCCGWALGIYFSGSDRPAIVSAATRWSGTAVIVIAAAGVVYGVWPEITRLEARETAYLAAHPPNTILLPRFWAQGWIGE